jgi:hypothetical protein
MESVRRHDPPASPKEGGNLRVAYTVGENSKSFLLMFGRCQKVGDFLRMVREKQRCDDLRVVYYEDVLLDNGDSFDDWYSPTAIFRVTNTRSRPPAPLPPPRPVLAVVFEASELAGGSVNPQ